ncbi:hypothetical protein [Cedecea neteri]|uniref:hypothetical protein n=1 Tax=Cedecea neteri TaxID=158822 RepID=UPI000580A7E9|nr:hypothetical protein [Cedecea neteri]
MKYQSLWVLLLLTGCVSQPQHQGVNWGEGNCPRPAVENVSPDNTLVLEDGKTLKCQIRPYVSRMACQGITDKTGADGVICQNSGGKQVAFLFDAKGILTQHRFF